ncbi:MAG: DUF1854 domain-containing protein [Azovibrio sp.]|uniref:cyanophycin metabolism-associated DUF1854 family protein n=1 Tax=Azovibrio sp. TaxID=1872673 RepID=UPI003C71F4E0
MKTLQLERNAFGQLVFTDAAGQRHTGVVPVRAFAITAPDQGLALMSPEGHELLWIDTLAALPETMARLLQEELEQREFMPEIRAIRHVSSFATPSTWEVDTDRGPTRLVLKGEEDIRRLGGSALIIADHHGLQYLIRDRQALDRQSRKFLMRFL